MRAILASPPFLPLRPHRQSGRRHPLPRVRVERQKHRRLQHPRGRDVPQVKRSMPAPGRVALRPSRRLRHHRRQIAPHQVQILRFQIRLKRRQRLQRLGRRHHFPKHRETERTAQRIPVHRRHGSTSSPLPTTSSPGHSCFSARGPSSSSGPPLRRPLFDPPPAFPSSGVRHSALRSSRHRPNPLPSRPNRPALPHPFLRQKSPARRAPPSRIAVPDTLENPHPAKPDLRSCPTQFSRPHPPGLPRREPPVKGFLLRPLAWPRPLLPPDHLSQPYR